METVGTSINPVVSGAPSPLTPSEPPAVPQPEVSAIQPAQDFIQSEVIDSVKTEDIKLKKRNSTRAESSRNYDGAQRQGRHFFSG